MYHGILDGVLEQKIHIRYKLRKYEESMGSG